MVKATCERQGLFQCTILRSYFISEGSQGRNSDIGTWRQRLKQKVWRNSSSLDVIGSHKCIGNSIIGRRGFVEVG